MATRLRIASVNVNGVRAAYRKGMGDWLDARDIAADADVEGLLGDGWNILHDAATAKGRAGVALASRKGSAASAPLAHRVALGADDFDSAGR